MIKTTVWIVFVVLLAVSLTWGLQSPPAASLPASKSSAQGPPETSQTAAPPAAAHRKITAYSLPPELYRKAHNRGRIRFASRLVGFFYGLFILWLILQRKWGARFRDWAEAVSRLRFLQALIFTPLVVLTIAVLQLPIDLFDEWVLKLYKISVQPWPSWFVDWTKAQFLTIVVGGVLVWLLYAVIRKSPTRWWLWFWVLSLPITLFFIFISPYVVEPMFNEFKPLAEQAPHLIEPLESVSYRAGQEIRPNRMFWMRASDKTIATNAYVSGFGASKRIVIWDTSLQQETTEGILTMFGHEMGHYVLGHVWKGFLFTCAMLFVLLYLTYRTIGWFLGRYGGAWGIRGLEDWASLPALLLLLSIFGSFATVAGNAYSRHNENQADIYSLEVTRGIVADPGQASAISFQKFGETVLVDPDPNPVNVFLFFDHPTVADRVHLCVTYDPWSAGKSPQFVK